jgi:hypothetical protein
VDKNTRKRGKDNMSNEMVPKEQEQERDAGQELSEESLETVSGGLLARSLCNNEVIEGVFTLNPKKRPDGA